MTMTGPGVPIVPASLDYTDKDFDALRRRLQALIRSVFPGWTDFNVANFGNLLLELFCFVGDVLCFYQDSNARESRISTAIQRKNLIGLAKLLNFTPSSARAATAVETFTLAKTMPGDVTIPARTLVKTPDVTEPIAMQLLAPLTIPAGSLTGSGVVEHSIVQQTVVPSSGLANQTALLPARPYLDGSARVSAGDGHYIETSSFLDSGPTDRHFTVAVDQNGTASLRFGNGVNGKIPVGSMTLYWKTGGGKKGNVRANTLVRIDGAFADSFGTPVGVTCTNADPSAGGEDRMTTGRIRYLAPESIRVAARSVAREDFEINARRVRGVARALMLTSDQHPGIPENSGLLFVIPTGGGLPTTTMKTEVLDMVSMTPAVFLATHGYEGGFPHTLTFHVDVMDPVYLVVNVQATVYLKQGATAATVKDQINQALEFLFEISRPDGTPNPQVDFGYNIKDSLGNPIGEIAWSDVLNQIRDVEGVRKVEEGSTGLLLNGARSDLPIGPFQFPVLGTVTIYNGDTGSPL